MYQIYKATSPSGRFYIGLTKQTAKVRWANHVRKAFSLPDYNHGLYNAIRKYGPETFRVEVLDLAGTKQEAQSLERKHIAASDKALLYNVSPGGEADGEVGGRLFWDALSADPEAKAIYLRKLSQAKLADDWSDYDKMAASAKEWRRNNPREAYRTAWRGVRLARRSQPKRPADTRPLKERLMWKHKRSEMVRKNTMRFWATVSDEARAVIKQKISSAVEANWSTVSDPAVRAEMTAAARASIDRKKQGAAASAGVKKWWVELKADPDRYAVYIAERKASLLRTLKEKK